MGISQADFETVLKVTLDSGDIGTFTIMAHHMRASVIFLPEKLELLENYCEQVLVRYKGLGDSLLLAGTHSILSCLQLLRGRGEEAVKEAEITRLISQKLGGIAMLEVESVVVLAHYHIGRGDYSALTPLLEACIPQLENKEKGTITVSIKSGGLWGFVVRGRFKVLYLLLVTIAEKIHPEFRANNSCFRGWSLELLTTLPREVVMSLVERRVT